MNLLKRLEWLNFRHLFGYRFASTSELPGPKDLERDCWNCLKRISCQTFICECGKLQQLSPSWNYFDFFGITKPTMNINMDSLARQKRNLQKAYHPDKFTRSSRKEQEIAASVSAKVNDAFKVLSCPITRAEYILTLNGSPCSSVDMAAADMEFLVEIMELNERVDELSKSPEKADEVDSQIASRWDEEMASVSACIEKEDWAAAHTALSRLRYFERLRNRVRELKPKLSAAGTGAQFK
ncbi:unnamed protein product [Mesocestoides corti]|uniref:J domain-containing protein n=1 Tax=Mesocestoides corti TaxID=53468 RepID=A0A0R3UR47_MESCO|nr:unnamed protein product [Mesocestoides corti]